MKPKSTRNKLAVKERDYFDSNPADRLKQVEKFRQLIAMCHPYDLNSLGNINYKWFYKKAYGIPYSWWKK